MRCRGEGYSCWLRGVVLGLLLQPVEHTHTHTHSQLTREQGTVFDLVLWAGSTLCIEITFVFVELLRGISTLYKELLLCN
jgi:hypothetical protein